MGRGRTGGAEEMAVGSAGDFGALVGPVSTSLSHMYIYMYIYVSEGLGSPQHHSGASLDGSRCIRGADVARWRGFGAPHHSDQSY